jgi:uncharacterized protein affecting Mg2+/Co2+ transport
MSHVNEITVRTQKTHVSVTCRSLWVNTEFTARPVQLDLYLYYVIGDRYPAIDMPIAYNYSRWPSAKADTVGKVRGCYSSDHIGHRDQIFTINISVFRLYCMFYGLVV